MPKKKLTETVVKNAERDPNGPYIQWLWDEKLTGFGVRLNPGGTKSFIVRYRNADHKQKTRTLGKCDHLKVKQARKKAHEILGEVAMGDDPFADDADNITDTITFGELANRYIEEHAKAHKKSWERDQKRYQRRLKDRWGNRLAKSIEYADVADLHREIGNEQGYKVEANRTLALIQKMFNWGRSAGYAARSKVNPAADVQKFAEHRRRRTVKAGEMPKLLAAIENEPKPFWRAAYYMLLLTGVRKSELKRIEWADVDLGHQTIQIRKGKTESARRTIPLSSPAVEILNGIERKPDNPFVFCGYVEGQPLVNLKDTWSRIRQRAGADDVTLHDLRRTVGSWLGQHCSELIIKRLLGHSVKGATGRYTHVDTCSEDVREAIEEYGRRLWEMHPNRSF